LQGANYAKPNAGDAAFKEGNFLAYMQLHLLKANQPTFPSSVYTTSSNTQRNVSMLQYT
jgi:hypothetical protein